MGPLLLSMARETVLWPCTAAIAVTALGAILHKKGFPLQLAIAIALACGFLVGYARIYGVFSFPPMEAQGWLPVFIASGFIVFAIDDLMDFPLPARLVCQGLFSTAGAILLLLPLLKTEFAGNLATLATSIMLWFGLWIYIDRQNGPALFFVAAGNAVVCATTGSTMLGQLGGVLAAVLGLYMALNFPRIRMPLGHAGTAVAAMILASLMLIGHAYAGTATRPTLLLLTAFAGQAAAGWLKKPLLAWPFSLIPVAIAIALALQYYFSQESGY
jgi:hypothetical protein